MTRDDILITNPAVLPKAGDPASLIQNGYVRIKDGKIIRLGPMSDLPATTSAALTIDGSGQLLLPGLVNTHNHAAMTLFRGLADDLPLMTWLNEHIFPAEAACVTPEMVYWCSKLAAAEMILSGTTTTADGYFHETEAARAFADAGLRTVAAQGVMDFPAPGVPDPTANVRAASDFIDAWHGKNELISPAVFCHSPYTCSPATLIKAKEMANGREIPFFIHVAETKNELEQIREPHGDSPLRHLQSLGILDRHTICVHCVWLDEDDLDLLAASGARVAICTKSNMKLASGVAPLPEMLARQIHVGLGTDSCASNNSLDLFSEMDFCAKLHKLSHLDPTLLPAPQSLRMATIGGATVLGLQEKVGTLEPGKCADLIMIDLQQPHLLPFYSPDLLVYSARGSDVETVIINGRLVLHQRQIQNFDLQETMARVRELATSVKNHRGCMCGARTNAEPRRT